MSRIDQIHEHMRASTKELAEYRCSFSGFCEDELDLNMTDFHKQLFYLANNNDRIAVMAPRGHGKTEILSVAYPLWLCLFNEDIEIMIIANTLDQSKKIIRRIKEHIRDSELLQNLRPDNPESVWTKTEIETTNGCQIFTRSYSPNVRGEQVNYSICDEASLYEDKKVFHRAIAPTVNSKDGDIVAIGTPQSANDLLADLVNNDEYASQKFKAFDEDGNPLWPERFGEDKLDSIKDQLGEISFKREYMTEPVEDETYVFPYEKLVSCFDESTGFEQAGEDEATYYIGSDLAMSKEYQGAYSVHIVVKREKVVKDSDTESGSGTHWVYRIVYIDRTKGLGYKAQKERIAEIFRKFEPVAHHVDQGTFGQAFVQDLQEELGPNIKPVQITHPVKMDMVNNLIGHVENERLIIPRKENDPNCMNKTDKLIDEMSEYGTTTTPSGKTTFEGFGQHDDCVDGLALSLYRTGQDNGFITEVYIG